MPEIDGIRIQGTVTEEQRRLLTPGAVEFLRELSRTFEPVRQALLRKRAERQVRIDAGEFPDFLPETRKVRDSSWTVAPIPRDLLDRKVEITGPVERKMIINALNSGANVFMADFEDSNSPTWKNNLDGQLNLIDAVRRTITFTNPQGKHYALKEKTATLMVRPRGWHLPEKHVLVDGDPMSASLFDFGLFFFHNARALVDRGTGPYFYLPKMESHLEARLWNDVFVFSQKKLGLPKGTIRATVLIETILAAFEMDEILYELREHSAGLNCGRWDYIFSFIKKVRNHPSFVLPDRASVTMEKPFLKAYVDLLIRTCHGRGIHAMGGMAAQIPIASDPVKNEAALEKVRQDKRREVTAGHDGTWVAHPDLVPVAMEIFRHHFSGPHQIGVKRGDVNVSAADLLEVPGGSITEQGLRTNINVGILYLEAWLRGSGCVPLYFLMEDAATAEISRTQVWQWVRHGAKTADGKTVDAALVRRMTEEELGKIKETLGAEKYGAGQFARASSLFVDMMTRAECPDFLTLVAYDYID
ncbi:MAG TPA: malate synthase A [Candidatus Eisenbacteria bacterium]|nr:malate synthase A [Candidatus Eisenbacteria bacterium]